MMIMKVKVSENNRSKWFWKWVKIESQNLMVL